MGIRGLTQLVSFLKQTKKIPFQNIQHFENQIWAIDASLFLYRARSMSVTNNEQIARKPSKFRNITYDVPFDKSHLVGIIDIFCQLLDSKILPFFVFDGEPPSEKNDTILKRREEKLKLQKKVEWVEKLMNSSQTSSILFDPSNVTTTNSTNNTNNTNNSKSWADIVKHSQQVNIDMTNREIEDIKKNIDKHKQQLSAVFLEPQHVYQTQTLCQIIGIPFLQSQGEAEVSCVTLQKNGIVHAVYTADSDVLVYGCTKMIRRIFNGNTVDVLDHDFILQELSLTHEQFVRFCILMGCDFCDGLITNNTDITPNNILKIAKNPDLQNNLLFNNFTQSMGEEWVEKAYRAFELYTNNEDMIQPEIQTIQFNNITKNKEQIILELHEQLQMNGEYVERLVTQILDAYHTYFFKDLPDLTNLTDLPDQTNQTDQTNLTNQTVNSCL
jgi:5'-3' exonuclease